MKSLTLTIAALTLFSIPVEAGQGQTGPRMQAIAPVYNECIKRAAHPEDFAPDSDSAKIALRLMSKCPITHAYIAACLAETDYNLEICTEFVKSAAELQLTEPGE